MKPSQEQLTIAKINENVYKKKKWTCVCDDCSEGAIVSHLLQQHGILDRIAENGQLFMVKTASAYGWQDDVEPVEFERTGIKQSISLPLFCNRHDTMLFSEIETKTLSPSLYRHQMLLSLRTSYSEIRKKQQAVEFFTRIGNANTLSQDMHRFARKVMDQENIGIRDITFYKDKLKRDLDESLNSFVFYSLEFPYIPICASSFFSLCDDGELLKNKNYILPAVFFHMFPQDNKSIVILGYYKEKSSQSIIDMIDMWKNCSDDKFGKVLTNLFAQRVETWAMSPSLYNQLSSMDKKRFIECIGESQRSIDQEWLDFNLFEGLY